MGINVAIDGPAGAGKSTIAKKVAKKRNFIYVDTGAMYRAVAYYMLKNNIDGNDEALVALKASEADVTIKYIDGEQVVFLNGENVNQYLRTEETGNMASLTSKNPAVRKRLTELQKKLAKENDVVMDGRDIGTVVLPDANVKIYLTADPHVRAKRRFDELVSKGEKPDIDEIEKSIILRDKQDMERKISPLKKADDAILVDSSYMSIDEVAEKILSLIK